jgi:ElaB/YqjD/DUF883 family membrane-anchored ribosome-binding protein
MDKRYLPIALGAGFGAVIGVLIGDILHLPAYWPHVITAVAAAAGVLVGTFILNRGHHSPGAS